MKTRRPDERKQEVMDAALALARESNYSYVTREAVAERAGCATGTVSRLYGTMPQFRRAIMSAAVARQDLRVIAQGIAAGEPKALAAKPQLKRKALESIL